MTIAVKARVQLTLDGVSYAPGEWITLPEEQRPRAQELMTYGLVDEAPAAPVRTRRRRTAGS